MLSIILTTNFAFAQAAIEPEWFLFDPAVIKNDRTEPVLYKTKMPEDVTGVQIRLENGSVVNLDNDGQGIWSVTLFAPEVLFDYGSEDVNHNFVGFLDVIVDGNTVKTLNLHINVLDQNIPDVPVFDHGSGFRYSSHVVNFHITGSLPPNGVFNPEVISITNNFYQFFTDDYDFINLVYPLPSANNNRFHQIVKNDVDGIGTAKVDSSHLFGSSGKLQGINVYPISTSFDLAETGSIHEIGHQWINYLNHPSFDNVGGAHWPISSLARGVMGFNDPNNGQGLNFPFELIPVGDGDYLLQLTELLREYTDLDLYLMGLLPKEQVGSHIVFENQNQNVCGGCILEGPVDVITVDDVIAVEGPRIPDASSSQKEFRVATIIVSGERLLNDEEMTFFDHFAARGEATQPLPFTSGRSGGITKPFFVATQGLGTLETSIPGVNCELSPSGPWIITQNCLISSDVIAPASVLIQNDSVVTVNSEGSLTILPGENIIIVKDSGLKLIQGSKLQVNS